MNSLVKRHPTSLINFLLGSSPFHHHHLDENYRRTWSRCLAVKANPKSQSTTVVDVKEENLRLVALYVRREAEKRTPTPRRCGVIALKLGMVQMFDDWGERLPITVLQLEGNVVVEHKTMERDGYLAMVVGSGPTKEKHLTKPVIGLYAKNEIPELRRRLDEFRVTPEYVLPIGSKVEAKHFVPGQMLDVCGTTIGKGFQGAMKRWGFSGQQDSHGTSRAHRSLGGTGSRQDPGRVFKGKKMHGHMGVRRKTIQNLFLFAIDPVNNRLFVKGHVPGHAGNVVRVTDAIKFPRQHRDDPVLTKLMASSPLWSATPVPLEERRKSSDKRVDDAGLVYAIKASKDPLSA